MLFEMPLWIIVVAVFLGIYNTWKMNRVLKNKEESKSGIAILLVLTFLFVFTCFYTTIPILIATVACFCVASNELFVDNVNDVNTIGAIFGIIGMVLTGFSLSLFVC